MRAEYSRCECPPTEIRPWVNVTDPECAACARPLDSRTARRLHDCRQIDLTPRYGFPRDRFRSTVDALNGR